MSRYRRPLVELDKLLATPWQQVIYRLLGPWMEKALGIEQLNRFYELCETSGKSPAEFADRVLELIGVQYVLPSEAELEALRAYQGPLVVVCNHPFGGIEAIFLVRFLSEIRPDFRIIANFFLERVEEVREMLLLVDPFGGEGAQQFNRQPLRQALAYLKAGNLLGIFPSGEVASWNWRTGRVREPEWHPLVGRLIWQSQAAVLPLYFHGTNSLLFHLAGLIHARLRTGLLIREFVSPSARKVHYRMGRLHPFERLRALGSPDRITSYLRAKTYLLGEAVESRWRRLRLYRWRQRFLPTHPLQPIRPPLRREVVDQLLSSLPPSQKLIEQGEWAVYYFRGSQQPQLLYELGRLRETTFRAAGEGTGKALDTDAYDTWYDHLVLYHTSEKEIIGAYRIGRCDEILQTRGLRGLYLYSLFHLRRTLFREIHPALELGRAFVTEKYQRAYAPLYLLWRGIGQYILQNPRYRFLIGPVSLSKHFSDLSKAFLVAFLEDRYKAEALVAEVRPRNPYVISSDHRRYYYTVAVQSLRDVEDLIQELEGSPIRLPVLIRHYLRMGARILAFNVDRSFNDALDILMLTDLLEVDPELMRKYMGEEGYERYRAFHGQKAIV
ncbi:MAG: lysophospholipid acyltransferase family protein [Bacteroidia bacterium]|nr:lysophospholipid acyltransferase family protein [Bacteroidia bacterium]MDW8089211.1 GNAT family N-acyltransferase [Bacteroidia bacterium]